MDRPADLCGDCGADLPPAFLACPSCGRLRHSETLKALAARAESAEHSGDHAAALVAWRDALVLLPPDSRQHASILQRLRRLSARVEEGPDRPSGSGWRKSLAAVGGAALLLLSKGKFLLLGLMKLPTLLSMLAWVAVYWSLWGWQFAVAMAVSIYIHEMGHVWMLGRYGIRATAPMFIPGLGALVRLKQPLATAVEDARVGLAGPLWGMAAAAASYGIYRATGSAFWGAVAELGALINLFNLLPVWQLDGGRGIRSLTRLQRWILAAAAGGMGYLSDPGDAPTLRLETLLLTVLGLGFVLRAVLGASPRRRDDLGLVQFVVLILILGALAAIRVPLPAAR